MTLAFLFPGQGAQHPGMGRALARRYPVAASVFDMVDDALGRPLSALMWDEEGEDAARELTRTENTQPALLAHGVAALRALEANFGISAGRASVMAGHSLGEYTALAAAGAIALDDAARLVEARGRAMQSAVPEGMGGMVALLGATPDQARKLCAAAAEGEVAELANDNAPGQIVISGHSGAMQRAAAAAREHGIKKAVPLPVSAPFHCSLMAPAAEAMRERLDAAEISAPAVPVIPNTLAEPTTDPDVIREALKGQITGQVRWTETVLRMAADGVATTAEAGPGATLTVMQRRTAKQLKGHALGTPEDLEAFAAALDGGGAG